jgi:hypothetical protein
VNAWRFISLSPSPGQGYLPADVVASAVTHGPSAAPLTMSESTRPGLQPSRSAAAERSLLERRVGHHSARQAHEPLTR